MTLALIAALLDQAAPLRLLHDEDAEAAGLPGIVNEINALRAAMAVQTGIYAVESPADVVEGADAPPGDDAQELEPARRGPGRPKKAV